jgi:hypothetical protein
MKLIGCFTVLPSVRRKITNNYRVVISEAKTEYLIGQPAFEIYKNWRPFDIATSHLLYPNLIHAFTSQPPSEILSRMKLQISGSICESYNVCTAVQIYLQSLASAQQKYTRSPRHTKANTH